MRFTTEHEFAAPPAAVAAVLCDPAFQTQLRLPDLSLPEIVEQSADGNTRVLRLRYGYTGQLDPIARRVIGGRNLTWIQELELDITTYRGRLTFAAEADPKKLFGEADLALVTVNETVTTRRINGDLHVRVPLIGGTAEKRIVPGLVNRLAVEAAAMAREIVARSK
jgi:hypothetical protein